MTSGVVGGEYGRMPIIIQPGSRLYSYQDNTKPNVWMSHGDEATKLPDGFRVVAKSEQVCGGSVQHACGETTLHQLNLAPCLPHACAHRSTAVAHASCKEASKGCLCTAPHCTTIMAPTSTGFVALLALLAPSNSSAPKEYISF